MSRDDHHRNIRNEGDSYSIKHIPLLGNPDGNSRVNENIARIQNKLSADNYSGLDAIGSYLKTHGTPLGNL